MRLPFNATCSDVASWRNDQPDWIQTFAIFINFSSLNHLGWHKRNLRGHCPRMPPVATGLSSRLLPATENPIASQFVKNRTHKTGSRDSTRITNKELSDLWKVPTPEGESMYCISGPFMPGELAAVLRRLKPGKSPGLDSIIPEFILHAGSALKSWFCDFLISCMRQLKIPNI